MAAALALIAVGARAAEAWTPLPAMTLPRQEVGVAALDGWIYVIGGITADRAASRAVDRFSPASGRWERVRDLPLALHHVGAAALDGRVYAVGGLDAAFGGSSSCFAYDPERNQWDAAASMPTARGAMGVAVLGGRIYAAGGQRPSTVAEFAAFRPGPGGGSWEALPPLPTPRNHLAAAAVNGLIFAISGRSGAGLRPQVESYDPAARAWSPRRSIPTPRGGIAAAAVGRSIFVFGGEGNPLDPNGIFPQTERYDVDADAWAPRLAMSVPRHGIGAAVIGDRIFIPGGSGVEGFGVSEANTAYLPAAADLPSFRRGDANGDGGVDITDPVAILLHLFDGAALDCADAADHDDGGTLEIGDAVALLEHIFLGGQQPAPPREPPGGDPTPDLLGCGS